MGHSSSNLLTGLLKQVSRSFYLTMRVLPAAIRPQIGLAYLLARTTDTIADTQIVSVEQRLATLGLLRNRILGVSTAPLEFESFADEQGSGPERALLEHSEEVLTLLEQFSPQDQQLIRDVLVVITSGQELDLKRFDGASSHRIVSLNTDEELDDYTWRVAGCVGVFWTKMCRTHLLAAANLDDAFLLENGVRFGKGLQLVNILRDLPADLRQGRCYLPGDRLWGVGLTPPDLLAPVNAPKLRPVYESYLDQARKNLAAGWLYTLALPRRNARIRLACAWPLLIGARTLEKLRAANPLAPELRVKVSRGEVRKIITRTILCYPLPTAWERLFVRTGSARNKVDSPEALG